jgi:glycosyltransferase involved in cell wall biosynthesis
MTNQASAYPQCDLDVQDDFRSGREGGDLLTVVVPVFNEQDVLVRFHERLAAVLDRLDLESEVIYVDDGSNDDSLGVMNRLHVTDCRVAVLRLSRNFGKEIAMSAGIDKARGNAVVVIDADLQDPPELIPELVCKWRSGCEVVYAQRTGREGESWLKQLTAHVFYRLIGRLSRVPIPVDTGDFRLLGARAVDAMRHIREQHRFMKGLFSWVGFSQIAVPYLREPRQGGNTKWSYWRLWNLAIEGITSFSISPLKIATYFGLSVAGFAFAMAVWVLIKTLLYGDPVQGYPTIMVTILLLGGTQLVAIGIMGEYIGRIFNESKQRPLYLVDQHRPARMHNKTVMRSPECSEVK